MPKSNKSLDLRERARHLVYKRYGIPGLIVIALFSVCAYTYMNWERVSKLPGISDYLAWHSRWGIPQADSHRFSILIAHLENDNNHEQERLIVEAMKEFGGVQVLRLDRTISLEGPIPEDQEKHGHDVARRYLEKSGSSVLIWGTVLSYNGKVVPKLYWTSAAPEGRMTRRYDAPVLEDQLRLPVLFWSDLANILRLLVASRDEEFSAQEGHYVADRLLPFIAQVRALLAASQDRPGWNSDARNRTKGILANALAVFGQQAGTSEFAREAVAVYREMLEEYTRDRAPLDWAMTQNNLGLALRSLGEHEGSTQHLEEAVAAFREALKEYTRDRAPLDWAMTQNNLGTALMSLGRRESSAEHLEEALAAFREALKEYTRDRAPNDWAMTQNNLGATLGSLGERESGTQRLEEAVAAFREALKEHTRDRVPLEWAAAQSNLGSALNLLGQRESSTEHLEEAVAACREALEEFTRDRVPLDWAATQSNLGNALRSLGEHEGSTQHLEEAVAAFREALKEYTRDRAPHDWAITQNNLGTALMSLGQRESSTEHLEEALAAYKNAQSVFDSRTNDHYSQDSQKNGPRINEPMDRRKK